jgi:type IV secretion system protein TrbL
MTACNLRREKRRQVVLRGSGRLVRWTLTGIVGTVIFTALAEAAFAQEVTGDLTDEFRLAAGVWTDRLRPLAQRTFALLAGIEFAVSAMVWGLRRESFDEAVGQFFLKCAVLSFLFMCLIFFDSWIPAIVNSFVLAGQTAAGVSELNPTQVLELGLDLYAAMMDNVFGLGLLLSPAESFAAVWGGLVVLLAFGVIAAQLVILLIESYIAVTAGVFFLGFAAFRGTASFTDRYLVWAVGVGIRLFLVYLIIGIGVSVAEGWAEYIATIGALDYFSAFRVVMGALVFALVAVIIPNRTSRYLLDGTSFGLSDAVRMK